MSSLSKTQIPPGGWQFHQAQSGWSAPTPIASTFDQTVVLILKHRLANPALVTKHNLATNKEAIATELEVFTRVRLGLPADVNAPPAPQQGATKRGGCCGS